jgi:hypothetical protein
MPRAAVFRCGSGLLISCPARGEERCARRRLGRSGRRRSKTPRCLPPRSPSPSEAPESAAAADPPAPADDKDGWVIRFEQQFNIFLTVSYKHRWPIDLSSDITFCLSEL